MNNIFNDLDWRLGAVRRYNLFPTIQQQTVAAHVHNVTRIAVRIAKYWWGWDKDLLFNVYEWAHNHENTESLSGDIIAMAKPFFDEAGFEKKHAALLPDDHRPGNDESMLRTIVKMADLMECYYFFCMEHALGNRYSSSHKVVMFERMVSYADKHCPEHIRLLHEWVGSIQMLASDPHTDNWSEQSHG